MKVISTLIVIMKITMVALLMLLLISSISGKSSSSLDADRNIGYPGHCTSHSKEICRVLKITINGKIVKKRICPRYDEHRCRSVDAKEM